jgi:nitrate reductase gamma subunit
LAYATSLGLWIGALAFHWSLLVVLVRHLRFFVTGEGPVPELVAFVQKADGFFEVGLPNFYVTTFIFLGALGYLLFRRLADHQVRYISLLDDYFLLFLLLGVGLSGFLLRHVFKTDIVGVKQLAVGLVSFPPAVPETVGALFFSHLLLVSVLMAYFPFSKLMHMPGVFLSPTRNLANNNRMVRHVNPWDYPVEVHTYEEYEDDFRQKMKEAGVPVERE